MSSKEGRSKKDARLGGAEALTAARSSRASQARRRKTRATSSPSKAKAPAVIRVASLGAGVYNSVSSGAKGTGVVSTAGAGAITELINNWVPGRGFEEVAGVWKEVGPVVRKLLLQLEIEDEARARRYLGALSRHTAARFRAGDLIEGPAELLNDAALAATFGSDKAMQRKDGTRRKEITCLRKIRALLLPTQFGVRNELIVGRSSAPLCFTEKELSQLFGYVRQRTSNNAKNLHAAMLLGLGAGLTGAELSMARGSDLISSPWGLFIETKGLSSGGNRGKRVVPILARYEDELSELAKEFQDGLFLGRTPTGEIREFSSLLTSRSKLPIFQISRARSNWVRALLENEVSFLSLRMAGVTVAKDGYLLELSEGLKLDFASYVQSVRGGSSEFDQSKHLHLRSYAVGQ